jgi:hypothetical protein
MVFPERVYKKILATPDDVVTATASYAEPPVPAAPTVKAARG